MKLTVWTIVGAVLCFSLGMLTAPKQRAVPYVSARPPLEEKDARLARIAADQSE